MQIPIVQSVDVLIVGGSTAAVETAVAACASGASVFLAASHPYLGSDMCATGRLYAETGKAPQSPVARQVLGPEPDSRPYRPMQIKNRLNMALIERGIDFRFGCFPTDILVDANESPRGVVFASRAGRWAVKARVIVDATPRALVARKAGNPFRAYPAGIYTFKRTVIGGDTLNGLDALQYARPMEVEYQDSTLSWPVTEYTLAIEMADGSITSFGNAEVQARKLTWSEGQVASSDMLFHIPPDTLCSKAPFADEWRGAQNLPLDALTADGTIFVLGPCSDLPGFATAEMLRPVDFMAVGKALGEHVAEQALRQEIAGALCVIKPKNKRRANGQAHELPCSYRPLSADPDTVDVPTDDAAVIGNCDVAVVGGGTGGAPAGVTAAREGCSTIVLEAQGQLGGVGTVGLIGRYYHGYRGGFTEEIDAGVDMLVKNPEAVKPDHDVEAKQCWFMREIDAAGGKIWFNALSYGALVENGKVAGVLVATPYGSGCVRCEITVDATGNADVAAAAGAPCVTVGPDDIAVQGTGLSPRTPGINYTNRDHTFIDDSDLLDTWRAMIGSQAKYEEMFDLAPIVNSRQRRQIIGEFAVSPIDIICGRTYPDTILTAQSNFDSHGYTVHPVFELKPPDQAGLSAHLPYRCLLPQNLPGILVLGLGISAHRDAMPILRMQPDIQNQGFAAGLAAAQAVADHRTLRDIDVRRIQQRLVEKGVLNADILYHHDSFPLPDSQLQSAVESAKSNYDGVAVLLSDPSRALPLIQAAFAQSAGENALTYAHILAVLGDGSGATELAEAIQTSDWDDGWNYTGMGQFGRSMSPLDDLIVALGRTQRVEIALPPILGKVKELDATSAFSHFRSIARALETLKDAAAAPILADLLQKPGVQGHCLLTIHDVLENLQDDWNDTSLRNAALRELVTARALYRCGDSQDLGKKILQRYSRDVRAHFATHAQAVLSGTG